MTTYRYKSPSIIEKVTFEKNDDGGTRAYLVARSDIPQSQLSQIANDLQDAGLQNTPATHNGESALEVRGFMWKSKCCNWLEKKGLVSGAPEIEESKTEKTSFFDKVKKQSLYTSGLLYVIGDIKFITYGIKGASPLNIAGGIFYALGTYFNLVFNRKSNTDLKVHDVAQQMADHMNSINLSIPKDSSLDRILDDSHKTSIHKIDDKLRHIPAELMVGSFAMAGACIAIAALKQLTHSNIAAGHVDEYLAKQIARAAKNPAIKVKSRAEAEKYLQRSHKIESWLDIGLGGMTFASGLIGAFVKEKAHDPDSPNKQGIEGWWEWVREHPLTVSGYGLMASTLCHAGSTTLAYKNGATDAKSAIMDRGVFVITNLMAEFLISISSKGHGEGVKSDKSIDSSAINVAAELITRQPQEQQANLIAYMAKFLGRPDVLALEDAEALKQLQHAVEEVKKNPWAMAKSQQAVAPSTLKQLPAWQQKLAVSQAAPPHLSV